MKWAVLANRFEATRRSTSDAILHAALNVALSLPYFQTMAVYRPRNAMARAFKHPQAMVGLANLGFPD
jgi:hypothetical protein